MYEISLKSNPNSVIATPKISNNTSCAVQTRSTFKRNEFNDVIDLSETFLNDTNFELSQSDLEKYKKSCNTCKIIREKILKESKTDTYYFNQNKFQKSKSTPTPKKKYKL